MKLFKSSKPNTFHYITAVAFDRVPIFRINEARQIFVDVLREIQELHPFKLVAYVVMLDHVHLIINPRKPEIDVILRKLKGKSARLIIDWLRDHGAAATLEKLRLEIKGREYAVWQKDSSVIDLSSHKF